MDNTNNQPEYQKNPNIFPAPTVPSGSVKQEIEISGKWENQIALVKKMVNPMGNCSNDEFAALFHLAKTYGLDPLKKEIWMVKYGSGAANIFAGRDGFLNIAHSTGQFGSMETTYEFEQDGITPKSATCIIWRKDYDKPFKNTVFYREYSTGQNLWRSKPCVMIGKVAESSCLRRAFNISGLYAVEEFDRKEMETKQA